MQSVSELKSQKLNNRMKYTVIFSLFCIHVITFIRLKIFL